MNRALQQVMSFHLHMPVYNKVRVSNFFPLLDPPQLGVRGGYEKLKN